MQLGVFEEHHQRHARKGHERRQRAHIQGDQLAGDGSTDVGAHDDPHRLAQAHQATVYKTDHHDRGGTGRLDHCGNTCAHRNAQETVGGEFFQDALHPVAGRGLQAAAHHVHAVKEERKASQKAHNICKLHDFSSCFRAGILPCPLAVS